jgi:hypothetical protein
MRRTLKKLARGNFRKKSRRKTRKIPRKKTRKKRGGADDVIPVPECFKCPITHAVMADPVIDRGGHTYERTAIEEWLGHSLTSPVTRDSMAIVDLVPNRALKDAIGAWNAAGKPAMVPLREPSDVQQELAAINVAIEELAVDTADDAWRHAARAYINNLIGRIKTQKEALSASVTVADSTSSSEEAVLALRAVQSIQTNIEEVGRLLANQYTLWLSKGGAVIDDVVELIPEE